MAARARKPRSKAGVAWSPPRPLALASDADIERVCREYVPGYDPKRGCGPKYVFDADRARRVIAFFYDCLTFIEGERAGQPFDLEPWQAAIVGNLFGWVDTKTGRRRYRESMILVARKNGKSPLCAGIALYLLLCDGEPGAQVYSAAPDRETASIIFRHASQMLQRSDALRDSADVLKSYRSIVSRLDEASVFKALPADADTKHGLSVHGCLIDELHAHPTRHLVDVLQTATGARREPLIVHITTSDYERESICNEKYDYASKVRDGVIDDLRFLPVLYETPKDADWTDPATWRYANPNLGISKQIDYLAREVDVAKNSPAYLNTVLRLDFNIKTNAIEAAIHPDDWRACAGSSSWKDLRDELAGRPCYGGLDLASTSDLCAFTLWFPQDQAALAWFWAPRDTAFERERRHRVPYLAWAREGALDLTAGNATDYDVVQADVLRIAAMYDVRAIAFDRWGAAQVMHHLTTEGLNILTMGQGYVSMSGPSKEFDVRIRRREIRHGQHPVLAWCASNLVWERDPADNWKPSKSRSREKIDGMTALIMSLGVAASQPGPQGLDIEAILLGGKGVVL